jgi:hypothetical protein
VLRAMLISPSFLYLGDVASPSSADAHAPLEAHALAGRLAAFLWQSAPDDELLAAADAGKLATKDDVVREARRLIDDVPKSERAVRAFARRWLDLERTKLLVKSASIYPGFNADVAPIVGEESELFVADVVLHGDARYETLMTAPYTFVSASTAPFYDLETAAPDGATFVKVALDPKTRGGLLTQLPFLALTGHAVQYSPTLRGKYVRQRFLCKVPNAPPENVDVTPPAPDETKTVRDQYRDHVTDRYCASCHGFMDPIGFGFARYDSAGRYRPAYFEHDPDTSGDPIEASWELDDSGEVFGSNDANGPFHGPLELGARLSTSKAAQDCFVLQWFRFALGRAETGFDAASLSRLRAEFQASGHDIRDLMVSLAASDAFRLRSISGESQ